MERQNIIGVIHVRGRDHGLVVDPVEVENFFDSRDHDYGGFHSLAMVGVVALLLYFE